MVGVVREFSNDQDEKYPLGCDSIFERPLHLKCPAQSSFLARVSRSLREVSKCSVPHSYPLRIREAENNQSSSLVELQRRMDASVSSVYGLEIYVAKDTIVHSSNVTALRCFVV